MLPRIVAQPSFLFSLPLTSFQSVISGPVCIDSSQPKGSSGRVPYIIFLVRVRITSLQWVCRSLCRTQVGAVDQRGTGSWWIFLPGHAFCTRVSHRSYNRNVIFSINKISECAPIPTVSWRFRNVGFIHLEIISLILSLFLVAALLLGRLYWELFASSLIGS